MRGFRLWYASETYTLITSLKRDARSGAQVQQKYGAELFLAGICPLNQLSKGAPRTPPAWMMSPHPDPGHTLRSPVGEDDVASPQHPLFSVVETLSEHRWGTSRERRRVCVRNAL